MFNDECLILNGECRRAEGAAGVRDQKEGSWEGGSRRPRCLMFNFGFWMEDGRPQLAYSPVYQCSVYQLASLRISLSRCARLSFG